jgi:pimeloyl-ACP methyl ester carboxylesterase
MVLPASFSVDGQTALDKSLDACEKDTSGDQACSKRFPRLRNEWESLLGSLPRLVSVRHPVTGIPESFSLTRNTLLRAVRFPLYVPALAAGLPAALHAAAQGDFSGLVGMANAIGSRKPMQLAMGMHFSVVCAEDAPRIASSALAPGKDFGRADAELYSAVCGFWPRGVVPDAFYSVPAAQSPVLLLSGGADPATPARHGESVAKALGALAQHVVVPEAGHGVMGVGCMGDVVYRFIVAATAAQAVPQDASCATGIPRPPTFVPIQPTVAAGEKP